LDGNSHCRTQARRWSGLVGAIVLTAFLGGASPLTAAPAEPPPDTVSADAMDWWSVDAGGGSASGGGWTVVSAVGQPDAGRLAGAAWTMDGGFVVEPASGEPPLFADGFESGDTGGWSSAHP